MNIPSGCMGIDVNELRGITAAGIDVRFGSWDVVIGQVIISPTTAMPVVRPVFIGKLQDMDQCLWVMRQYNTRYAVVDCRPETTEAIRLQAAGLKAGIKIWRAQYHTALGGTTEMFEDESERLLKLDRTLTLDNVLQAFSTGLNVILPQNFRDITRIQGERQKGSAGFAREMCNATRVLVTTTGGKECYTYEGIGADHSLHATNYLFVAVKLSNLLSVGVRELVGATKGLVVNRDNAVPTKIESSPKSIGVKIVLDFDRIEKEDQARDEFNFAM